MTCKFSPDLMGAAEIGRLLGVSRQRVQQLVNTPGFPTPAAVLDMGKAWYADDISTWVVDRRPVHPGRDGADA